MIQPELLSIPFARDATSGTKNDIPNDPSPTLPAQTATWTLGFPAVTMQPLAVGGLPPLGQDFNGVLGAISEHTVYQNAGGVYLFDQALADAIGGYSKGAVLMDDARGALYASLVDSNTTNFNTTPASIGVQWKPIAGLLATETQTGTAAIATQSEVNNGMIDNKIVTPKKLSARIELIPDANETRRGFSTVATQAEVDAGVDDAKIVTSKKLRMGFSAILNKNGYIALPSWMGGLILQWGISYSKPDEATRFVFPVAFPSELLVGGAFPNAVDTLTAFFATVSGTSASKTSIDVHSWASRDARAQGGLASTVFVIGK